MFGGYRVGSLVPVRLCMRPPMQVPQASAPLVHEGRLVAAVTSSPA